MGRITSTKSSKRDASKQDEGRARERRPGPRNAQSDILALQQTAGNRAVSQSLGRDGKARPRRTPADAGQPLDPATRARMEGRFGQDFSHVRVHTGSQAEESARALDANAYTVGQDVVFGEGRYAPDTDAGKRLLAHELTHVVQQTRAPGAEESGAQASSGVAEAEADSRGNQAAAGQAVSVRAGAGVGIQRQAASASSEWDELFKLSPYLKEEHRPISPAHKQRDVRLGKNFDELIADARTEPSSKGPGQHSRGEVTIDELCEIMPALKELRKVDEKKVKRYHENLNEAFRIFGIDTLESQALFLAHAAVESKQLSKITEGQKDERLFLDSPPELKDLYTADFETLYPEEKQVPDKDKPGQMKTVKNEHRQSIDPIRNKWHFIGRGPVQVTHDYNYLRTLAVLQRRADDLRQEALQEAIGPGGADNPDTKQKMEQGEKLARMVKEILKDPTRASDPEFTFLFSAAYAKKPWGDKGAQSPAPFDVSARAPAFKQVPDPEAAKKKVMSLESAWMTGNNPDPKGAKKYKAYQEALRILSKKP